MSRDQARALAVAALLVALVLGAIFWLAAEPAPPEQAAAPERARDGDGPSAFELGAPEVAAPAALRVVRVLDADSLPPPLPPALVVESDFAQTSTVRGCVRLYGRPAPGAAVEARQDGGTGAQSLSAWPTIHCDAGGCFEAVFDAHATIRLRASLGVAASEWVSVETSSSSEHEIVLDLLEPYVIRGRVTYADGEAASLCIVTARCGDDEFDSFGVLVTSAGTGADGRFEIPIDRAGTYAVEAQHLPDFVATQRDVTVNDAQPEVAVALTLAPRGP